MKKNTLFMAIVFCMTIGISNAWAYYGNPDWSSFIGIPFVILAVTIVLALIFREFICWYWKINEKVALLKKINDQLALLQEGTESSIGGRTIGADAEAVALVAEEDKK